MSRERFGLFLLVASGALFCFVVGVIVGLLLVAPYGYVEAPCWAIQGIGP